MSVFPLDANGNTDINISIVMHTVKIKISMETNKEMCLCFNLTKDNEEWQKEGK